MADKCNTIIEQYAATKVFYNLDAKTLEGRLKLVGGLIDAQRIGSGNGGFDEMTQKDVGANIKLLKELNIRMIGVGGHDSSDEVIQQFASEFGDAYRYVKVGKRIDM